MKKSYYNKKRKTTKRSYIRKKNKTRKVKINKKTKRGGSFLLPKTWFGRKKPTTPEQQQKKQQDENIDEFITETINSDKLDLYFSKVSHDLFKQGKEKRFLKNNFIETSDYVIKNLENIKNFFILLGINDKDYSAEGVSGDSKIKKIFMCLTILESTTNIDEKFTNILDTNLNHENKYFYDREYQQKFVKKIFNIYDDLLHNLIVDFSPQTKDSQTKLLEHVIKMTPTIVGENPYYDINESRTFEKLQSDLEKK